MQLLICYGSETGNCEAISKSLYARAKDKQVDATCVTLNEFDKVGFMNATLVAIVVSTTGNGEPPRNADKFFRHIKKRIHASDLLSDMKFIVLGLGDTNYDKFCHCAKTIDKRLEDLGAKRLVPTTFVDEGTGQLGDQVEPWLDNILSAIFPSTESENLGTTSLGNNDKVPTIEDEIAPSPLDSKYEGDITVLYGSETGNSEAIAKSMYGAFIGQGRTAHLGILNDYADVIKLSTVRFAIVIVSTTGNGDPPRNAERFWRFLRKRTHPTDMLHNLRYIVLALGDTNYDKFCFIGTTLNKRFHELGAETAFELTCIDEAVGMLEDVEKWKSDVFRITGAHSLTHSAMASPQSRVPESFTERTTPETRERATSKDRTVYQGDFVVAYGSETGNGESISKFLYDTALSQGRHVQLLPLNDLADASKLVSTKLVIIVVSTTGNGDPPRNAERFWRFVRRRTHPTDLLLGLKFLTLALGDTNYDKFCFVGKTLNKRLLELGAEQLMDLCCVDEAVCMMEDVESWKSDMFRQVGIQPSPKDMPVSDTIPVRPTLELTNTQHKGSSPIVILHDPELTDCSLIAHEIQNALTAKMDSRDIALALTMPNAQEIDWNTARVVVFVIASESIRASSPMVDAFVHWMRESPSLKTHGNLKYSITVIGSKGSIAYPGTLEHEIETTMQQFSIPKVGETEWTEDASVPLASIVATPSFRILLDEWVRESPRAKRIPEKRTPEETPFVIDQPILKFEDVCDIKNIADLQKNTRRPATFNTCLVKVRRGPEMENIVTPRTRARSHSASMESTGAASTTGLSSSNPMQARLTTAKYLTSPESPRRVVHVSMSLLQNVYPETLPQWQPGDAVGIICPNPRPLVLAILERLKLIPSTLIQVVVSSQQSSAMSSNRAFVQERPLFPSLDEICSIEEIFTWGVDLTSLPKKTLLRTLAEHCSDDVDYHRLMYLSSIGGKDTFEKLFEAQSPTLLEILRMFPSCSPPLESLLFSLPQLAPRFYSIANSPLGPEGFSKIDIAFTVIENKLDILPSSEPRILRGICTNWLEGLARPIIENRESEAVVIKVFLRRSPGFHLPGNLELPIVMIGPGTGVAPFVGFIEHRRYLKGLQDNADYDMYSGFWRGKTQMNPLVLQDISREPQEYPSSTLGSAQLYFGCRSRDIDFIFKDFLLEAAECGEALTQLRCAFSRENTSEKRYVQHLLGEDGEKIAHHILQEDGFVFVCGDGTAMAKDVHQALQDILTSHGKMQTMKATQYLNEMAKRGRYVRDIWS